MCRRTSIRSESGQAMVEFALVVPILLLLVLGIVQFGVAWRNSIALTDAVSAGARAAAIAGPAGATKAATDAIQAEASDLDVGSLRVTVTTSGSTVVVTATYPYSFSLPGIAGIKDGRLSSTSTRAFE